MKTKMKSQWKGICWSLFLGPFGLFYSMGWKAVIAIVVWGLLIPVFSGDPLVWVALTPIASVIASVLAVRTHNNRVESYARNVLNEQAEVARMERLRMEETRLRVEEIEKVKLDAERTRLARERVGLEIERERLRTDTREPQKIQYTSNCSTCGAATSRELQEGTIQKAAVCNYCGSPLELRE